MKHSFVKYIVALALLFLCAEPLRAAKTLQEINRQVTQISEKYSGLKGWENGTSLVRATEKLDRQLAEKIVALFNRYHDISKVKEKTHGILSWREWPANVTDVKRIQFQVNDVKSIQINYRIYQKKAGPKVYLIENSFWNTNGEGRINPSAYTVIVDHGKATLSFLPNSPLAATRWKFSSPCFLGFVDREHHVPDVIYLEGPSGTGRFASIVRYTFDKSRNIWTTHDILFDVSPVVRYAYDEKQQIFTYYESRVGGRKHSIAIGGEVSGTKTRFPKTQP